MAIGFTPQYTVVDLGDGRTMLVETARLRTCPECGRQFSYDGFRRIILCRPNCNGRDDDRPEHYLDPVGVVQ